MMPRRVDGGQASERFEDVDGWIRTELGGPDAPIVVEESAPRLIEILFAKRERPGLEYHDRDGQAAPW